MKQIKRKAIGFFLGSLGVIGIILGWEKFR